MVKEQLSVQLWNRSPIELYALTWLADAPLSSVEDLTATAGFTQQEWTRALARLTKDGEVEALPLGASRDMTPRYVLTMSGLRHILEWFPQKVPWSASAAGVKGIATRLAFAEQIYRMAPTLLDPKRLCVPYANAIGLQARTLTGLEWVPSDTPHAIARYGDRIAIGLVWIGLQTTATEIEKKWVRRCGNLTGSINARGLTTAHGPQPSGWLVICHDEWAGHLATRFFGPDDPTVKVVVSGALATGHWPLRDASGFTLTTNTEKPGNIDRAIKDIDKQYAKPGIRGKLATRALSTIEEYYDLPPSLLASMCGVYTHDVERVLRAAVNSGLVVKDEKGKIRTSKDGLRRSAHRDRLHPATPYGRWKFLM